jgi:hypothetical protein
VGNKIPVEINDEYDQYFDLNIWPVRIIKNLPWHFALFPLPS